MHPGAHPPERTAQIMGGSTEKQTYGELDAGANRASQLFREAGLTPGDHVAFCIENHPRYLELLWGAHYAGLLYTAISTRLNADEIAYIVNDCGAEVFVLSARYADRGADVAKGTPDVQRHLSLGGEIEGYESLEDALAGQPDAPLHEDRTAGADMLYSSGTTGQPKGISPKQPENPLETPTLITPILQKVLGVAEDSVYLSPAPLYHAAPLRFCMGVQQIGATVIMLERFDEQQALELIERYGVTHTQWVPTMFVRALRLPQETREGVDVSSLQAAVHAAAPCPADVKQRMIDWWGPIIHEYYGGTEGNGITWITSNEWLGHQGSVGRAVIGKPRIMGEDGRELRPDETGYVFFSDGPQFQYHNDEAKTQAAYNEHGWSTMGDIGHLDDEGYLYLTDRVSFTIITGGINVYPQEAEDALLSHDAVFDAAVFGIPNEEFGEEVKAVVQPGEMPADDDGAAELEQQLIEHCRAKLADVKCPRSIDFRAELPRADTGKLYKRQLKEEYAQAAAG